MENEQKRTQSNKKKLIDALEKSLGIVTEACEKAQLSRTQFYKWYKEDKKFRQQVDSIEGKFIDFTETHLKEQIKNNNTQATIFYLKTRGRKRGYGDSLDITSGEEPITINVKINGVEY